MTIKIGDIFGNWTVIEKDLSKKRHWICQCNCILKTIRPVFEGSLQSGKSTNCGCARKNWFNKKTEDEKKAIQQKRENTCIEKYGVDNPSKDADIIEKIKTTFQEKYGVDNISNLQETKDKIRNTHLEKYGVPCYLQSEDGKEKSKETSIKNWGTEHPMQSQERQEVFKESMIETYGEDNPLKVQELLEKMQQTIIAKYGVDNISKLTEIKQKKLITIHETLKDQKGSSIPEKEMIEFIESFNLTTRKLASGGLEIDIYIDDKKIGFEHNGLYYHNELGKKDHNYHVIKTDHYEKQGIKVVQIWGHWWQYRRDQVKNFIKGVLGVNSKIHGRKTTVKQIDKETSWNFIDKHHILGSNKRTVLALGLFQEDQLLMVTTFSTHHRDHKEIILDRMCSLDGITVIGGLSKLSKAAQKILKCDIYTWADRCISSGQSYIKAGWEQISISPPDYFYYSPNTHQTCSKQSRRKSAVNTPDNMLEHEHAKLDGWVRVFDCGKIKFKYPFKES